MLQCLGVSVFSWFLVPALKACCQLLSNFGVIFWVNDFDFSFKNLVVFCACLVVDLEVWSLAVCLCSLIGCLHNPANVQQTSSKCIQNKRELLNVCWTFDRRLLEVCWMFTRLMLLLNVVKYLFLPLKDLVMGCLHDPANVQQIFSKCIQNTRANAGRLLDCVNTLTLLPLDLAF